MLIAHGVYNYDTWESPEGELTEQISLSRDLLSFRGSVLYGYSALKANTKGLSDETKDCFAQEIIYSDPVSDYSQIKIEGSTDVVTTAYVYTLRGHADPALPFTLNGKKVSRDKSGDFEVQIPLSMGENRLLLKSGDNKKTITVTRE